MDGRRRFEMGGVEPRNGGPCAQPRAGERKGRSAEAPLRVSAPDRPTGRRVGKLSLSRGPRPGRSRTRAHPPPARAGVVAANGSLPSTTTTARCWERQSADATTAASGRFCLRRRGPRRLRSSTFFPACGGECTGRTGSPPMGRRSWASSLAPACLTLASSWAFTRSWRRPTRRRSKSVAGTQAAAAAGRARVGAGRARDGPKARPGRSSGRRWEPEVAPPWTDRRPRGRQPGL